MALPQRATGAPTSVELREVARPVSLARERTLPVLAALERVADAIAARGLFP